MAETTEPQSAPQSSSSDPLDEAADAANQASDATQKAASAAKSTAGTGGAAENAIETVAGTATGAAASATKEAKDSVEGAADKAAAAAKSTAGAKPAAAPAAGTTAAKATPAGAAAGAASATAAKAATATGAAAGTAKPASAARPAAARPAAAKEEAAPPPAPRSVTRREFLNYVWGASIALFLAQFAGLSFLFAMPRFRAGQFGGVITVSLDTYPPVNDPPVPNNVGKFWQVNVDNPGHKGIAALYKVCTHLGCIYGWSDSAGIFACPCHGSQFQLDGKYIAGPAPRSLDRFSFQVLDANGSVLVDSPDGEFVEVPSGAASVAVNTGNKIPGASHF